MKELKYGLLILFLLLTIFQNVHFSDFCEGVSEGLLFAFTCLIFLISFIIVQLLDLYNFFKKKEKFDFIPLYIFVAAILINTILISANENKYWREIKYQGKIDNIDKECWIVLFNDNKFEVTISYIEQRCTYVGKYHFENNHLVLDDQSIESKTDENFTSQYELISDTILQPVTKNFDRIILSIINSRTHNSR